ncbi:hypothetical protein [Azospirillum argentinense]
MIDFRKIQQKRVNGNKDETQLNYKTISGLQVMFRCLNGRWTNRPMGAI